MGIKWHDLNVDGLYQANEYKRTDISKIIYEENEDRLVLLSGGDCRELGGAEVYCVYNWKSGNRSAVKVGALGAPKPTAFIAEGDYYYVVGLESRGTTWVHRMDIGYGVNAQKRKTANTLFLSRMIIFQKFYCIAGALPIIALNRLYLLYLSLRKENQDIIIRF